MSEEGFEKFLRNFQEPTSGDFKYREALAKMGLYDKRSLTIDIDDLLNWGDGSLCWELLATPERSITLASKAALSVMRVEDAAFADQVKAVFARFSGLPRDHQVRIADLRAEHLDAMVELSGIVSSLTPVRPQITKAAFRCKACGEELSILQEEPVFRRPTVCPNLVDCPSKRGPFELVTEECEWVNWQRAMLQDAPEDLDLGQLPSSVPLVLIDDLVGRVRPGDRLTATGILRALPDKGKRSQSREFLMFLDTNHMAIEGQGAAQQALWAPDEVPEFRRKASAPDWCETLRACVAPGISGHERIKAAVLAVLAGGCRHGHRRGDIHILLIGDPGLGKSIIIAAACELCVRALLTSGKGTSAAGLTAAVVPDPIGGGFTLEAGALVLASGGMAAIDELDKMSKPDRSALHEAMEQQRVSIAKAGISATLNARTSIIAAANPKAGRFDPDKVPSENINLPPTLLSRFDLIFTMLDVPQDERDEQVVDHILSDVRANGTHTEPPLAQDFVRRFLAFARTQRPTLSDAAATSIRSRYLEVRKQGQAPESPMPITARQLEAMIRLSEAHAKLCLHEVVTEGDADWAWQLMRSSLHDIGQESEGGVVDVDTIMTGVPKATRAARDVVLKVMRDLKQTVGKRIPESEIIKAAGEEGVGAKLAKSALESLCRDGDLAAWRLRDEEPRYSILGGAA